MSFAPLRLLKVPHIYDFVEEKIEEFPFALNILW